MSGNGLFEAHVVFLAINAFVFYFPLLLKPVFSISGSLYEIFIYLPCAVLSLYALFACFIKRLNDLEVSRYWALLFIVPILNGFFFLYLFFARPKNCLLLKIERFLQSLAKETPEPPSVRF